MNVISPRTLRAFWTEHPQAEVSLKVWQKGMQKSKLQNLNEVRTFYPTADLASSKGGITLTVFNISGNSYRLITRIDYRRQRVFIVHILTHAEYNKWNAQGRPA